MDPAAVISENNPRLNDLVFYRPQDKLSTELDQETVILDMESGIYSQLNPVGTTIWNQLEQPVALTTIIQKIVTVYEVKEEECRKDVLTFLQDLSRNELIKAEYA